MLQTVLKCLWNIFQDRLYVSYKISLNKVKRIKTISSIFSHHHVMKIEINYMKETGKLTNMWRLNNILLNNQRVQKKSKKNFKNTWNKWKWSISKFMGFPEATHGNKCLLKSKEKSQINKLTSHLKELEKVQLYETQS